MIIKSEPCPSQRSSFGAPSSVRGFTLVEVAIVLVIVGLLIGLGVELMGPLTKRVKLNETRSIVKEVYASIVGYAISNKTLPSSLTALGIKTKDAYSRDLLYYAAGGITGPDLCKTQGTYLTVNDIGTNKSNVAFIIFSEGENCNQTGTASPFTISEFDVTVACPSDANAGYDDIVMYQDINTLREQICNVFRIVTDSLPTDTEEVAYPAATLEATDGTTAYTWSVLSGSLPPGLSLNASGLVSGTPTAAGSYNFTASVTDAEGRTAAKSFVITINPNDPKITTEFLHYGRVSSAYSATLSATGGQGTYTWSIVGQSQGTNGCTGLNYPIASSDIGLCMTTGGIISGTPSISGTYSFTVRITDGRGRIAITTLSIAIND